LIATIQARGETTVEEIRVLIVDDHAVVRRGMAALLSGRDEINVVGEAANGETAVEMAQALEPQLILMDLKMPTMDGVTATRQIKQAVPSCKILVITSFSEDELVISALRAGADGYLLKSSLPDDLFTAILDVINGGAPLDRSITATVLHNLQGKEDANARAHDELTGRELVVLRLVAAGMSDVQIGETLQISKRTASTHVGNILSKLGVENRTQAALYAMRNDLFSRE